MTGPEFSDAERMDGPASGSGHARTPCGARLKQARDDGRTTCDRPAGWGTDHVGTGTCRTHGGNTPNHRKHAQEQQARAQAARLGVPVVTSGAAAVEHALALAHGQMLVAAAVVAELPPDQLVVLDKSGSSRVCGQVAFFQESLRDYARQAKDVVGLGLDAQRLQFERDRVEMMIVAFQRAIGLVRELALADGANVAEVLADHSLGPLVYQALTEVGGEVQA